MLNVQKAFTLIELLVTLAVMAILVALAAPSFQSLIESSKSESRADNISAEISYARSEALKRPALVSVCASSDGETCGTDWAAGFIVFLDTATTENAVSPVLANSQAILRYWKPSESNLTITATRNGTAVNFFRFTTLGALARNDANTVVITVSAPSCIAHRGQHKQSITIGLTGSASLDQLDCP